MMSINNDLAGKNMIINYVLLHNSFIFTDYPNSLEYKFGSWGQEQENELKTRKTKLTTDWRHAVERC